MKLAPISLALSLLALGSVWFFHAQDHRVSPLQKETAFERVMRTQTIRCAYASWPPYFKIDPNTKQKSGIFYDLTEAIGKSANLKIEWGEEVSYSLVSQNLSSGKQDVFCGLMWTSPHRGKRIEFTAPIAYMPLYAYVREGDARFDHNLAAINDNRITIASQDGSSMQGIASATFPLAKQFTIPELSDAVQVIANVAAGKADVVFVNPDTMRDYNRNNPGKSLRLVPSATPLRLFGESLGVAKGEWELRDFLNVVLAELQGDGTIDRILTQYETEPGSFKRVAHPYVDTDKQ